MSRRTPPAARPGCPDWPPGRAGQGRRPAGRRTSTRALPSSSPSASHSWRAGDGRDVPLARGAVLVEPYRRDKGQGGGVRGRGRDRGRSGWGDEGREDGGASQDKDPATPATAPTARSKRGRAPAPAGGSSSRGRVSRFEGRMVTGGAPWRRGCNVVRSVCAPGTPVSVTPITVGEGTRQGAGGGRHPRPTGPPREQGRAAPAGRLPGGRFDDDGPAVRAQLAVGHQAARSYTRKTPPGTWRDRLTPVR